MKIYTKIRINMNGDILEEESYEYKDEVALCCGGGGGVTVVEPPPSETELEIQKLILAQMKEPKVLSENEQLMEDYSKQLLETRLEGLPAEKEMQELSMALLKEQIGYSRDMLARLSEAKELGEITGDLTEDEITKLDQLEENAISRLTEVVGEDAQEIVKSEIAQLVDRGVLQGNIGARAIAKIGEAATKEIARGTTDIESLRIQQELGMEESKRQFGLQYQSLVQQGILTREQAIMGMAQNVMPQQFAQAQFATQAGQFQPQLKQQWEMAKLTGGIQQWGQMAGMRGAEADRATQAAIANSQAKAATTASMFGAVGNIAGMAGAAAIYSSKGFKEKINKIDKTTEDKFLEEIKKAPLYSYKYKDDIADGGKHFGLITEEAPKEIVTEDGKYFDVINYIGYLTGCIKALANQVEAMQGRE